MVDVVTTGNLDDSKIKTEWQDGELWVTWHRFGQTLAGIVLSEEHAIRLGAAIIDAVSDKREEQ